MNKEIPVLNRICGYKQFKRAWEIHESKLKSLKGSIDMVSPKKYIFDKKNKMQTQCSVLSHRDREIENENRILLEKLTNVPRDSLSRVSRYEARTDASRDFSYLKRHHNNSQSAMGLYKSIQVENEEFAKRIQSKKSTYSIKRYLQDRQKTQNYINLMSRFPNKCRLKPQRSQYKVNQPIIHMVYTFLLRQMWMKNSPDKYVDIERSIMHHLRPDKSRQLFMEKVFQHRIYEIQGNVNSQNVNILIKSRSNPVEKHDISLDTPTANKILDTYFQGNFRKMLDAIDYNKKTSQFYIRLPEQQQATTSERGDTVHTHSDPSTSKKLHRSDAGLSVKHNQLVYQR